MAKALTLLRLLSACRQTVGRKLIAASSWLLGFRKRRPSALAPALLLSRRHSPVCCCLLCEQHDTGEQAMRSVGGDYRRFLAFVGTPRSVDGYTADAPAPYAPSQSLSGPLRPR